MSFQRSRALAPPPRIHDHNRTFQVSPSRRHCSVYQPTQRYPPCESLPPCTSVALPMNTASSACTCTVSSDHVRFAMKRRPGLALAQTLELRLARHRLATLEV